MSHTVAGALGGTFGLMNLFTRASGLCTVALVQQWPGPGVRSNLTVSQKARQATGAWLVASAGRPASNQTTAVRTAVIAKRRYELSTPLKCLAMDQSCRAL